MISRPTPRRRARTSTPWLHRVRTSAAGPAARPVVVFPVVASIAVLVAGVAWPQAADALLRLLIATLALGFVAVRAHRAVEPLRTTRGRYSPFGRPTVERTPAVAPWALRKLTAELNAAGDARSARRTAIPSSATRIVRKEATRRLAEHHGLNLCDPTHHRRIRSLVSEPTWLLIHPDDPQAGPGTRPTARGPSVPLSRLGRILDDLEAL